MFNSRNLPREPIFITEADVHNYTASMLQPTNKGLQSRNIQDYPRGSTPFLQPFDLPIIPRSEWKDRIEFIERTGTLLSTLLLDNNVPSLNQQQTNYCWTNGVVTAVQAIHVLGGLGYTALSPASVAAKIKNYRNEGGWGGEALKYIVENGIDTAEGWPPNAIDPRYDTAESKARRKKNMVTDWYDLPERNFDAMMTCLLLGLPVPVGYNWWSHEVCAIDPFYKDGAYGIRIRNSWGDTYGSNGFAILMESKATPDDAVCPKIVLAA